MELLCPVVKAWHNLERKHCLLESPSACLFRDEIWKEMTYYLTKDLPGF